MLPTVSLFSEFEGNVEAFAFLGCYSGLLFVLWANALGLYRPKAVLSASAQFRGVLIAWGAVLLFVTSILFLLKSGADYSRGATIAFGFASLGTSDSFCVPSPGANFAERWQLVRFLDNALLLSEILKSSQLYPPVDYFKRMAHGRSRVSNCHRRIILVRKLSTTWRSSIPGSGSAQANEAECVLLALRWINKWHRDLICERLRALPLPVLLLPDRFVSSLVSRARWGFNAELPIEVQRAPLSRENLLAKRILDLTLAVLGLVVFAVPAAVICAAIMLDSPGPVIFRQRRKGFNGREFPIYKFRTMTVLEDGPTVQQARRDDARVTKVGRLLRATSLDEVPQLINVLKGEMSLVGPRPHALAHDDEYSNSIKKYAFRHHVKPGITGWAQVNGCWRNRRHCPDE